MTAFSVALVLCCALNATAQSAQFLDPHIAESKKQLGLEVAATDQQSGGGDQQQGGAASPSVPAASGLKKKSEGGGNQGQATQKPSTHPGTSDVVGVTFSSVPLSETPESGVVSVKFANLEEAVKELKGGKPIDWSGENELQKAILSATSIQSAPAKNDFSCVSKPAKDEAYIFHIKWWTNDAKTPIDGGELVSSNWYAYHMSGTKLVRDGLGGSGDPVIYGAKNVLVVGIDIFDTYDSQGSRYGGHLSTKYQVSVTQGTPANWSNLGSLVSGALGLKTQQTAAGANNYSGYIALACQQGTKALPFDAAINETVLDSKTDPTKAPAMPAAGNVSCTGSGESTPCAMSRTFTSTDKEFWDVSMGVAIPGVKETGFTFSTTSNTVSTKKTTHTEAYAFIDIFPFAYWQSKDSAAPHINLGVPVTTKSLYRPYFGLAENLTGWNGAQQKMKLPTGISVFGGMCWMKTQQILGPLPTTQSAFNSALTYHHVWKPMFGVEVSVSALASKLGGKSKNANGNTSTSQAGGQ